MATVKSLLIQIGVDTKRLESGFKKANSSIQSHSAQFKKAGMAMTAAGAAITGTLGMMVKGYMETGDWVDKMSKRTGFSAQSLSELAYAADISGASLNDIEKGVKKMAKSIVDADAGLETYIRSFRRIGISMDELRGKNPEEQFRIISEAIAELEDPTLRAATAQEIFGRAGTTLLPLMAEGAAGLEALREEARETGNVFDQETAKKAADLKDSLTTLKNSFKGVTNTVAEALLPTLKSVVGRVTEVVQKIKDWMKSHPKLGSTIVKIVGAVGLLLTVLGPLVMMLPLLAAGFQLLLGPIGWVILIITGLIAVGYLVVKNWTKIKNFFAKIWGAIATFATNIFNGIKKFFIEWALGIATILSKIPIVKKFAGPMKEALQDMRAELDKTKENVTTAAEVVSEKGIEMAQGMLAALKSTELYANITEQLADKTTFLGMVFGVAKKGVKFLGDAFLAAKEKAKGLGDTQREISEVIVALTQTMTEELMAMQKTEYENAKWMLQQKYLDRKDTIEKEIAAGKAGHEALLLNKKNYDAAVKELDKKEKERKEQDRKDELAKETEFHNAKGALLGTYFEGLKDKYENFKSAMTGYMDAYKQLTMDDLAYRAEKTEEWYKSEQEKREEDYMQGVISHAEYLQSLAELDALYHEQKAALELEAKERQKVALEEMLANISMVLGQIGGLFRMAHQNRMTELDQEQTRRQEALDADLKATISAIDEKYEARKKAAAANIKDEDKRNARIAEIEQARLDAIRYAEEEAAAAERRMEEEMERKKSAERRKAAKQEKAVALLSAIVNTAAAVVKALPNIPLAIAVGILGAIQIALIAAQPLPLKKGGMIMGPTLVEAGEAGPELYLPLDKLRGGGLPWQQPAPVLMKLTIYNYGDIHNVGDLDEISERLAQRTTRMMERGRRQ